MYINFYYFKIILINASLLLLDAVWTKNKTLALLTLYEANLYILDNLTKKTKIWTEISKGLQDFNIKKIIQGVADHPNQSNISKTERDRQKYFRQKL